MGNHQPLYDMAVRICEAAGLPDFSVFRGAPLQQKHLLASAARQKLRKGNEQDGYYVKSYHLLDEEQGCGAALCFEAVNRGPDYGTQTVAAEGVYFYRFTYPILFDYIPESRRCDLQELPEAFVKRAFVAFSGAAGLRRAKETFPAIPPLFQKLHIPMGNVLP